MNIKQKVVSGIAWNFIARIGQEVLHFAISIFLVRLLEPKDFGLVAMAIIIINFARLFTEQGFSEALIQNQKICTEHYHSVFWLSTITGFVLAATMFISATLVARFYDIHILSDITRALALGFFITSLAIVPRALLIKQLLFRKIAFIEISAISLSSTVAISVAIAGFGVWSLIIQNLLLGLIMTVLYWRTAQWRPQFTFQWHAVKDLYQYGVNLIGFRLVDFWAGNLDNLLIGRYLGSASLGVYKQAYRLMLLPESLISGVIGKVMFPVLSKFQEQPKRVKQIYLNAMGVISLMASPLMLGMLVTAESFISAIYGSKWLAVVPLIQILCGVGLLRSIMAPTGWIYRSQNKTDWLLKWGLTGSLTLVLGICVGVWIGTTKAVAMSFAVANLLLFYPCIMIPGKLINMRFTEVIKVVSGPFIIAVIMAASLWLFKLILNPEWPASFILAIRVSFGAILYTIMLHLFDVQAYYKVRSLLSERLGLTRIKATNVKLSNQRTLSISQIQNSLK